MPVTNAYVKFSELPDAAKVASNDQIAVLDVSEGVLCKTSVAHASTATTYGVGNKTAYGHVKVLDAPASTVFNAGEALAASKGKEIIDHLTASNNTPFRFGYNSATGEYGYILKQGGADTVIPFKTKHTGTYIATARKTNNDMGETHTYRYVDTTGVPNANSGTYPATARKANNDMGATNTYRYVDTTRVPNYNDGTYSFPVGSTGATYDMGATNTIQKVNAESVYNKGVSDGKNVNNVSINNPYYGFISGNKNQDRTFTNPYSVSARCYAYNGGHSGVSEIRIYVNEALVADSGDSSDSQSWEGVVGVGGSVRMTHEGAAGSSDKPCEVSLVWAACL